MVERLPTNRAGHLARTKLVLIPVPGWWLVERRGQGWSLMRLIQYKLWLQYRCLRTSSIHCRGFKRLESCIFANVIITLSNLLHCNHGKLYWHRLSPSFPKQLRGAVWPEECWLVLAAWDLRSVKPELHLEPQSALTRRGRGSNHRVTRRAEK